MGSGIRAKNKLESYSFFSSGITGYNLKRPNDVLQDIGTQTFQIGFDSKEGGFIQLRDNEGKARSRY
jgi:hypothetical protein